MNWRVPLSTLFVVQNYSPTLRSSIFSMLCTGLPFIAGLVFARPLDGMLAAIFGMLLMLNDYGGNLRQRMYNQLWIVGGLLLGSLLVMLIHQLLPQVNLREHDYPALYLLCVLLITAGNGWAQGNGKLLEGFIRSIALALLVIVELPYIDLTLLIFLLGSAALSVLARLLDHVLAPRQFDAAIIPLTENLARAVNGSNNGWRYPLVYSACIVGGLLLGVLLGTGKPYWIAITIMMTMRPDAALNLIRSVQRIGGTLIGVAIAGLIVHYIHNLWWICAIVLLLGLTLPHGIPMNYGLHCTLLAAFVLLLFITATLQYGSDDVGLLRERVYDVVLGCVIALTGTLLAFPRKVQG